MTDDEQEALSVSLTKGRWCVPLESGRIAVFAHPAKSRVLAICDNWAGVLAVKTPAMEPAGKVAVRVLARLAPEVSLEELEVMLRD